MKKLKTRNEYVGCNGKCRFYADTIEAYSYKHWCFVMVINGKVIFNDYAYSHTTNRHQREVKWLLRDLGIKIDAYVYMSKSLTEENFKQHALRAFYVSIVRNIVKNNTKRVRKKTITRNINDNKRWHEEIKVLRAMGAEYTFKDILSDYRHYKGLRDDNEKTIQYIKDNKGKVYKEKGENNFVQIVERSSNGSIVLRRLDDSLPHWRKKYTTTLDCLKNRYISSPLYSTMLGK